jgi:hypothetical protein
MVKRKLNLKIQRTIAFTASIICVLFLFSHLFSVSIQASSENNFMYDLSACADSCDHPYSDENSASQNESNPRCTESCSSGSCCNVLALSSTTISTNSIGLITAYLNSVKLFYTEDMLCSIFKPPKI